MITIDRFFEISKRAQAFSGKDLQTAAVMLTWFQHCGFSLQEFVEFVMSAPQLYRLFDIGYFNPTPSVRQSKEIRQIEKLLPKEQREMWRKARLRNMYSGATSGG